MEMSLPLMNASLEGDQLIKATDLKNLVIEPILNEMVPLRGEGVAKPHKHKLYDTRHQRFSFRRIVKKSFFIPAMVRQCSRGQIGNRPDKKYKARR